MNSPAGTASIGEIGRIDARRLCRRSARIGVRLSFYLSVFLIFSISPMRLDAWGDPYDVVGGGILAKVHPGTWAAFAALGLGCLVLRRPIEIANTFVARRGLLALFFAWLFLAVTTALFLDVPLTPLIDVFLLPMVIFFLFELDLVEPERGLATLIHALMAANAAIGIVEYATGWRLTPYVFAIYDWRSTALLGHPLANAALTGAYILILLFGGGAACRDLF